MKTKNTLLSIAIIAALPFGANAEQTTVTSQTPAQVGANGTVNVVATGGPYQIADIGEHDDEHIATTAYVKGAYNDTIRAVNKLGANLNDLSIFTNDILGEKQGKLYIENDTIATISNNVAGVVASPDAIVNYVLGDSAIKEQILEQESDKLATLAGIAVSVDETFNAKKVAVYTTWGNDNAKTPVALANITDF